MSEKMQLGACFAMVALGPVAHKRLFGGYDVPGSSVVSATTFAFQQGALLGLARADKYQLLCALIAQPGCEASVAELCQTEARKLWDQYGNDSPSLSTYAMRVEFPNLNLADPAVLMTIASRKFRLGEILNRCAIAAANGIGFGATRPDDFRAMWTRTYEKIDEESWHEMVQAGLNIPAKPEVLPLSEATQAVLAETAQYVREHFPDLLVPLDLECWGPEGKAIAP